MCNTVCIFVLYILQGVVIFCVLYSYLPYVSLEVDV